MKNRGFGRHWVTLALSTVALAPLLSVSFEASAGFQGGETAWAAKKRVLKKMKTDPSVLINVTSREMPGSPDVLNLGKRATKPLERCVSDNADPSIRVRCIQLLREIGDRSALPTLRSALEDWEESVRHEVAWTLETMPDSDSFAPLIKLYKREDETEWVRNNVIDALGAMGSHDAVRFLRRELRAMAKGPDRRSRLFRAVWRSRHLMARATLVGDVVYALRSDNQALVLAATEASSEIREVALVRPLVPLMDHKNVEIRNKAVYALGRIGDKSAARALLGHLPKVREARMLNNIGFALERLDPKAFYKAIDGLAAHKQAIIRLNAAFVVGDVRRPEGLPILERSLGDASDFVRTSAIVAIGKLGTDKGISKLEKFADDPNPSIRQEAIYAINQLSKGKHDALIYDKLFSSTLANSRSGSPIKKRAAIELGRLDDERVRDYLFLCYETRRCRYSDVKGFFERNKHPHTPGRLLLSWARGRFELTNLVGSQKPAGALAIATSSYDQALATERDRFVHRSADLLGHVGNDATATRVADELKSDDLFRRLHVGTAATRLGHATAPAALLADLDNAPVTYLPLMVRVLESITEPKARAVLAAELDRRAKGHEDLAMAAAAVLLAWDPEKGFFRFLDALASKSTRERELAAQYLRRQRSKKLTWVMRRALAREGRPFTRDRLRTLLDSRS